MLRAFGHPVPTCCDMLGVVCSNLKMVKFFMQHLWKLHDVGVVWPGSCNNVAPRHAHWFDFQLAKRVQHVVPNNVAICCFQMLWESSSQTLFEQTRWIEDDFCLAVSSKSASY